MRELQAAICDTLRTEHDFPIMAQWLEAEFNSARGIQLVGHAPWAAVQLARVSAAELDSSITHLENAWKPIENSSSSHDIARWLENSRCLQKLYLHRRRPEDIERARALAIETVNFVLERETDADLIPHIWGSAQSDILKPGEVAFEFASQAFATLLRISPGDAEMIRRYRVSVEGLWRKAYPTSHNTLGQEVFELATGMSWPSASESA